MKNALAFYPISQFGEVEENFFHMKRIIRNAKVDQSQKV